MFFVGIFGINEKEKPVTTYNNIVCPACQALTHLDIFKAYSYFHFFFIPIFRWNQRYYGKTACCSSIFKVGPVKAEQFDRGQIPDLRPENLEPKSYDLPYKKCANCGAASETKYRFCPYCGNKL